LAVILSRARGEAAAALRERYRPACLAGLVLLALGVGVYLPLGAVAGRYSMPAVWGADLCVAVLLSLLAAAPAVWWRRAAYAALGCGLAVVAVANLGKQSKFAARAAVLWQALEHVQGVAPEAACVGWVGVGDASGRGQLDLEEGIHFAWHLLARGRADLRLQLLDRDGRPRQRREVGSAEQLPTLLLTGSVAAPPCGSWRLAREFSAPYWAGKRRFHCYLWTASLAATEESEAR
jgi:hypothetical protein